MNLRVRPGIVDSYCRAFDISRDELARLMKVSPTTSWRVAHGRTEPSSKFIGALHHTTGLPFEALIEVIGEDTSRRASRSGRQIRARSTDASWPRSTERDPLSTSPRRRSA